MNFPDRTNEARTFVEDLWARRKVGYLLDQIRVNGENKELVTEVVTLAKRYGITTPYTSYLVVPDAPVPVARFPRPEGKPDVRFHVPAAAVPPALQRQKGTAGAPDRTATVTDFVKGKKGDDKLGGASGTGLFGGGYSSTFGGYGGLGGFRGAFEASKYKEAAGKEAPSDLGDKAERDRKERKALISAFDQMKTFEQARELLGKKDLDAVQAGRLGVDLSVQTNALRTQARLTQSATRNIQNRSVLEVGGVWIDEGFDPKMKTVAVKAMSKAYFRILERHPSIRQVFQLGNYLVWVTPSRTALVIDSNDGVEQLSDADIDRLFAAPPAKEESKKS